MREFYSYEQWVAYVLDEDAELAYRAIYDAYLLVQNPRSFGLFFLIQRRACLDGKREYVLERTQGDYKLILVGEQGREAFVEYLLERFSPHERDMAQWHQRRDQWYGDDLDSWEAADGSPMP